MGTENLKPIQLSHEEAVENGRKGGIASGKKRAETRKLKDTLELLLAMPMKSGALDSLENFSNLEELKGKNLQSGDLMALSLIMKVVKKGDVPAYLAVRDTIGQKPTDIVENRNVDINIDYGVDGDDI